MSIHPDIVAWKRRFGACLAAALGGLLLSGARDVTHELRHREAHLAAVSAEVCAWACQVAARPLAAPSAGDLDQRAVFLVQASSVPASHGRQRAGR
ncbi:MAG: hypothetical protein JXR77_03640 [Lentisphaeria bacterium]|nr:hypothetical protein [Lentisphaeria bacterium]